MEFTIEQLEFLVKLGPIDGQVRVKMLPPRGGGEEGCWFAYRVSELAAEILRERNRAESAEAERDILQWASDHSGGGGSRAGSGGGGGGKITGDGWYVHKFGPLGEWISSEPKKPDPHPEGEACDVGECSCNMGEEKTTAMYAALDEINRELLEKTEPYEMPQWSPERPHEALVWCIYHAAALMAGETFHADKADSGLNHWRARWSDSNEDHR